MHNSAAEPAIAFFENVDPGFLHEQNFLYNVCTLEHLLTYFRALSCTPERPRFSSVDRNPATHHPLYSIILCKVDCRYASSKSVIVPRGLTLLQHQTSGVPCQQEQGLCAAASASSISV